MTSASRSRSALISSAPLSGTSRAASWRRLCWPPGSPRPVLRGRGAPARPLASGGLRHQRRTADAGVAVATAGAVAVGLDPNRAAAALVAAGEHGAPGDRWGLLLLHQGGATDAGVAVATAGAVAHLVDADLAAAPLVTAGERGASFDRCHDRFLHSSCCPATL